MANGAVRELITRVAFRLDKASLNAVNKTIRKLKQDLNSLNHSKNNVKIGVNAAAVNSALSRIKSQFSGVNLRINSNAAVSKLKRQLSSANFRINVTPSLSKIKSQIESANLRINAIPQVMSIRAGVVNLQGKIAIPQARASHTARATNGGSGGSAAGELANSALGLAAAYGGYIGTGQIISTADAMLSLDGRIRGVTKSEQERLDIESQLYAMGQKTGSSLQSLGSLYIAVARASNEMGFAQKDNLKVAETVSKALAVGGASAQEAQATILQLGQALGSGVLQGDELRSLNENASVLMDGIAKYFKTTKAGLKEMGRQGALSSEEVMKAIISASAEIDKQFADLPMTFGQAMSIMGNSWDRFILKVEQKSTVFSTIAKGFSKAFEDLGNTFDDFTVLMGTPDPNKMVTITEASTGKTKQISEKDYYNQKAAQNPYMAEAVKQLKEFVKMLDKLDGKIRNIDEQIADWVKMLLKVGTVLTPILAVLGAISAAITILSPVFSMIAAALEQIAAALEPVIAAFSGLSVGELVLVFAILASVIYTVIEYWDELVTWFEPGIKMMKEGVEDLQEAWREVQPLIEALLPLLKVVATLIGVTIVGWLTIMFTVWSWVFNKIAALIKWVSGLLGDLGSLIQWLGDGLSNLINKALEFIGMKGSIAETNRSFVQRMWDDATGNNTTNTQTNTFNLANMAQLPVAVNSANSYFYQ